MIWLGYVGLGTGLISLLLLLLASYKYGQGLVPPNNRYIRGSIGFFVVTGIILVILIIARG